MGRGQCLCHIHVVGRTGFFVAVTSLTMKDNGQRMGIACSICFHPTDAPVDLTDLVLLLGNVETKEGDFLLFSLGEGGNSSTTTQGGKSVMLGFCIICTLSLNE
jgi:hypothetical protein